MWNGPRSKGFVRLSLIGNGAVICPACGVRPVTDGLDEIREAGG